VLLIYRDYFIHFYILLLLIIYYFGCNLFKMLEYRLRVTWFYVNNFGGTKLKRNYIWGYANKSGWMQLIPTTHLGACKRSRWIAVDRNMQLNTPTFTGKNNSPCIQWRLSRVCELHTGRDGAVLQSAKSHGWSKQLCPLHWVWVKGDELYQPEKLKWRSLNYLLLWTQQYRLCSLVVRVPGCRSRDPGSISGATRFSEK
jgi:hypothetical protein